MADPVSPKEEEIKEILNQPMNSEFSPVDPSEYMSEDLEAAGIPTKQSGQEKPSSSNSNVDSWKSDNNKFYRQENPTTKQTFTSEQNTAQDNKASDEMMRQARLNANYSGRSVDFELDKLRRGSK